MGFFALVTLRGAEVGLSLFRARQAAANRAASGQLDQATSLATSLSVADSQTPVAEDLPAGDSFPGEEQAASGIGEPTFAAQDSGSPDQTILSGDDNVVTAAAALRVEIATARSRHAATAQATISRPELAINEKLLSVIDGISTLVDKGFSSIGRLLAFATDTAQPIVRRFPSKRFPKSATQTPDSKLPAADVTESIAESSVAENPDSENSFAITSESEEHAADVSEEKLAFAPGTTVISNQSTGVVHYLANDEIYSLQPGEIQVLRGDGPRLIRFHRGDDLGDGSFEVADGRYDFIVNDGAWDLRVRDLATGSY